MDSPLAPSLDLDQTLDCVSGIQPDENGWVPWYACSSNYFYYPSFLIAVIFTVLFAFILGVHTYQAVAHKMLRLSWVVLMCAAWEVIGLATRAASTKNQQSMLLSYFSTIFVLVAPIWLNAFVYMILGRMVYFFLPDQKLWGIRARRIALWFVCGDIISFVVQAGGGSLVLNSNPVKIQTLGIHIYMSGIAVQEFIILVFTAFALHFRARMLSLESMTEEHLPGKGVSQSVSRLRGWRVLFYALLVTLALITVRIIYRLVEFAPGFDQNNYLAFHEWCFYVLDVGIMSVALVVMNVVHPGRVLVGPDIVPSPGLSWKEDLDARSVCSNKVGEEEVGEEDAEKGEKCSGENVVKTPA